MIVADTSVWIGHLRGQDRRVVAALERGEILMHEFIIGELACGNLRNRGELLDLWSRMPHAPAATHGEVLVFLHQHRLMGSGLGYTDVHLLASTALAGTAKLWTRDATLAAAAAKLGLAHDPSR